jgi:hypothetical protein
MVNMMPEMPGVKPYTPWKMRGKSCRSLGRVRSVTGQKDRGAVVDVHEEDGVDKSQVRA